MATLAIGARQITQACRKDTASVRELQRRLASRRRGGDAAQLPEADRQRYREQAIAFLRAELNSAKQQLASASPTERANIIAFLKIWPLDSDLAPLRNDETLWSEHAELLK